MKKSYINYCVMIIIIAVLAITAYIINFYSETPGLTDGILHSILDEELSPVEKIASQDLQAPDLILLGARQEAKNRTVYNASYQAMDYPGGDVSSNQGACTDVIIRALRNAGYDLQKLIHEDMQENFALYPANWGLTAPDPNIDHRRVPNQIQFLKRFGNELSTEVEGNLDEWQWGDIVYWRFDNGLDHCGIISDKTSADGKPLVIHNASVAREENCLTRWEITGHFRYPPVDY